METKELTCINCPMGCQLIVKIDGDNIEVKGNACPRGEIYGKDEATHPTRTVTSTIYVTNGERVSCKTSIPISKDKIFDVMNEVKKAKAIAPIAIGDILIKNVCSTGADIIATKNIN